MKYEQLFREEGVLYYYMIKIWAMIWYFQHIFLLGTTGRSHTQHRLECPLDRVITLFLLIAENNEIILETPPLSAL